VPEGDTVYRAAARLHTALAGRVVERFDLRVPQLATLDLRGRTVHAVVPRGKHLLARIGDQTLHSHLKMEGEWHVYAPGARWRKPAFQARAIVGVATADAVGFDLAMIEVVPTTREDELVGHLGPDLLGSDWDPDLAVANLRSRPDAPIGDALLEQRNLAGVGNVYKSELCFLGRVDPLTPVAAVPDLPLIVEKAKRLLEANKDRVTRITTADSRRGQQLWVYGRRGPCLRCGTRISKADQGPPGQERPTYWCPRCQPLPIG
jgi:endonuclease-8